MCTKEGRRKISQRSNCYSLQSSITCFLSLLDTVALLSFGVGLFGVLVSDLSAVMEKGFFQGYSTTVGIVICLQVYVCVCGGEGGGG